MHLEHPVLTRRIPTPPWGEIADRHVVLYDEYVQSGGYQALETALGMAPQDIVEQVRSANLRGRGGAGFSCGLKWSFLPEPDGKPRYLAVNCDEAEPCTFKDRVLCDCDPHLVLEGIAITCHACRIDTAFFYIRGEYREQAVIVQQAIDEAYEKGIFGGTGLLQGTGTHPVECYLHRGAGAYIAGEDTGMLESIEGKRAWPRLKPPFPAVVGIFGRPTIVNNVETLAAVPSIIEHGAEWFTSIGTESSIGGAPSYGPKLMGVSGHVARPGLYEAPLGITLRVLVDEYCGGMQGGKEFKGAIAGGVSMGVLGPEQFDAELDFDIGTKYAVMGLGTACPTVFDEDTDMVAVARNIARFFRNESCGQCTPCREGTGWAYDLLCRIEKGDASSRDLDLLLEISGSMGIMQGTTICGLADGNNWALRTIINKYREEFESRVGPAIPSLNILQ